MMMQKKENKTKHFNPNKYLIFIFIKDKTIHAKQWKKKTMIM